MKPKSLQWFIHAVLQAGPARSAEVLMEVGRRVEAQGRTIDALGIRVAELELVSRKLNHEIIRVLELVETADLEAMKKGLEYGTVTTLEILRTMRRASQEVRARFH